MRSYSVSVRRATTGQSKVVQNDLYACVAPGWPLCARVERLRDLVGQILGVAWPHQVAVAPVEHLVGDAARRRRDDRLAMYHTLQRY